MAVSADQEVNGRVAEIDPVLKRTRAVAALNAESLPITECASAVSPALLFSG